MKNTISKLFIIISIVAVVSDLQAQNMMFVKDTSGGESSYNLSNIRQLMFSEQDMTVTNTNGSIDTFAFANVRYLNFDIYTNYETSNFSKSNNDFILYPNPVIDQLCIYSKTSGQKNVKLEIIDIHGRIVNPENNYIINDNNIFTINIARLSKGLYICRLRTDENVENIKFIKN